MSKEELIKLILELKPQIISDQLLGRLSTEELLSVYNANRFLSYYQLLMKQQMILAIKSIFKDAYSLVSLYMYEYEEINKLYCKAMLISPKEFDKKVDSALKEFLEVAKKDNIEEYMTFSREEQIIASGLLIPDEITISNLVERHKAKKVSNPDISDEQPDLFTIAEEMIQNEDALIARIREIDKKLEFFRNDLEGDYERIKTCDSRIKHEISSDIVYTENQIRTLEAARANLVGILGRDPFETLKR